MFANGRCVSSAMPQDATGCHRRPLAATALPVGRGMGEAGLSVSREGLASRLEGSKVRIEGLEVFSRRRTGGLPVTLASTPEASCRS